MSNLDSKKLLEVINSYPHKTRIVELNELAKERNFYALNILPKYKEVLKNYTSWNTERINLDSKNLHSYSYLLDDNEYSDYSKKLDEINASFGYKQKSLSIEGMIDSKINDVFKIIIYNYSEVLGDNFKNIKLDYKLYQSFKKLVFEYNKITLVSTSNYDSYDI